MVIVYESAFVFSTDNSSSTSTPNSKRDFVLEIQLQVKVSISVQHFKVSVSKVQITPKVEVSPELLSTFLPATLPSKTTQVETSIQHDQFRMFNETSLVSIKHTRYTIVHIE
ncbi:hypothetical protein TNCV_1891791 [Trichonephila clavipes]|nr:hypothetical protein TNCV_1891791 [Trichonephila clavipes]